LRPNVVFHDQTVFRGERAASIVRKTVTDPGNRFLYPALNDIVNVQADGEGSLIIDLTRRSTFLPDDLEVPLDLGDGTKEHTIGTGPYQVAKYTKKEVVLKRFDAYQRGQPAIEQVVIRPLSTLRTGWASLLRGELDMVTAVPPDVIPFVKNDQVDVYTFSRRYLYALAFNSKRKPFTSPSIRRALNMAVDREDIVNQIFRKAGTPAAGPFWPKHWAYDPSFRPYAFDPAEARKIFDAAGLGIPSRPNSERLPARFTFRCLLPEGFAVLEEMGLALQKQFYDVGVDMQFEVLPYAEFKNRVDVGDFDALVLDINSGPTLTRPYIFWRSAQTARSPYNVFGYENPTTEDLFQKLLSSPNDTSVRSTIRQLQKAMTDDPPAIFLAWQDRTRAVRRTFQVEQETGRDPIFTLWHWHADRSGRVASNR
jgi:peptide/nickel transport system substrate-binding protein